jgi:hypothetical protein
MIWFIVGGVCLLVSVLTLLLFAGGRIKDSEVDKLLKDGDGGNKGIDKDGGD